MKSIIIAAGPSLRLRPLTENTPKTLLKIEGKSILERILDTQRRCGIHEIAIVRGYQKEKISVPNVTYFDNDNYMNNNILNSLFYAEDFMEEGFIFSYCDILYADNVVQKLLDSPHDISLIIDTEWAKRYKGRTDHPTDEAELACVENGLVIRLSKFFNPDVAYGEFIGLAKFSQKGAEILRRNYHRAKENKWTKFNGRFHDATIMDYAYLTDMIQELIMRGYPVHSVDIKNNWVEIDTMQDYEYAKAMIKQGIL
ncbi:MAG: NTP transferase domain-containing protein [Candidatus Hermodarchaeota archaeon]